MSRFSTQPLEDVRNKGPNALGRVEFTLTLGNRTVQDMNSGAESGTFSLVHTDKSWLILARSQIVAVGGFGLLFVRGKVELMGVMTITLVA